MAKLKSTLPNMVIVLSVIAAVTSLALAYVYSITKEPIAQAQIQKLNAAISEVVPGLEEFKEYKVPIFDASGKVSDSLTFYDVYKDGVIIGTAVNAYDKDGFSGLIKVMVGFDTLGNTIKSLPLEQNETPGLGDKLERNKSKFTHQFDTINLAKVNLKVKNDGGDIDAITAATISSRAYCRAIKQAYDAYTANKQIKEEGGEDETVE